MSAALNDLTTSTVLQMHALSRTYSALIAEETGASAKDADIASILPDIPRDAATLIASRTSPPRFFREGARGTSLSGSTPTGPDTAAIAAAATAAVTAAMQKPSDEPRTTAFPPATTLSLGQRQRQLDAAGTQFSISAATPRRPKKPFDHTFFRTSKKFGTPKPGKKVRRLSDKH
jgi:hypothetical protein